METRALPFDKSKLPKSCLPCLVKALDRTRRLLDQEAVSQDSDQIHSAKSILYAAIEQLGTRGERIFTMQRMFRELLSIVASQYETAGRDKEIGLQILDDLGNRLAGL